MVLITFNKALIDRYLDEVIPIVSLISSPIVFIFAIYVIAFIVINQYGGPDPGGECIFK